MGNTKKKNLKKIKNIRCQSPNVIITLYLNILFLISRYIDPNIGWPIAQNPYWEEWSAFGACSVSCGGGVQTYKRICNNPSKLGDCIGSNTKIDACNTQACLTGIEKILAFKPINNKTKFSQ